MILCLVNDFFIWLRNVVLIIWLSLNNELERVETASIMMQAKENFKQILSY
jgi:hypothetical protein